MEDVISESGFNKTRRGILILILEGQLCLLECA